MWVNGCRGGRLRSSHSDDHHPQKFQSCTLRHPLTTQCDPTRSFLYSRTIFNPDISRRRRSLIRADDRNRALSSLRASPGCGVLQNGSGCPGPRTNLSSTLISSPVPAEPSHLGSRSATQTSCHAFDKAIPSSQPTLIRHYSMLKSKVSPPPTLLATSYPSSAPGVLPSSSSPSIFS